MLLIFLFVFPTYPDIMLCYLFCYMSTKVISHTDIPLSSDIFLDSPIIDIHILFVSAIVMLALKID